MNVGQKNFPEPMRHLDGQVKRRLDLHKTDQRIFKTFIQMGNIGHFFTYCGNIILVLLVIHPTLETR